MVGQPAVIGIQSRGTVGTYIDSEDVLVINGVVQATIVRNQAVLWFIVGKLRIGVDALAAIGKIVCVKIVLVIVVVVTIAGGQI